MTLPMGCDVASMCSLKTKGLHSKFALRGSTFEASKRHQNASEIPTRQPFIAHHRKDKLMQDTRKRHPRTSHIHEQASSFALQLKFGRDSVRAPPLPPPPPLAKDMQTTMADGTCVRCMKTHNKHSNSPTRQHENTRPSRNKDLTRFDAQPQTAAVALRPVKCVTSTAQAKLQ